MMNSRGIGGVGLCLLLQAVVALAQSGHDIAGQWSGTLVLDISKGRYEMLPVTVTFERRAGDLVSGAWHTTRSSAVQASGNVNGTIARKTDRYAIDVVFTYRGQLPFPADGEAASTTCEGSAKASGQFALTSVAASGQPARWTIRLKSFDGFRFVSCNRVGYATWKLARH